MNPGNTDVFWAEYWDEYLDTFGPSAYVEAREVLYRNSSRHDDQQDEAP